nr:insulinase family protein [Pyrinomonadaceae bacterium]
AQATPTPAASPQDSKAAPASKVERKGKAPLSKEILRVNLRKPVEATLDNGLTVLIMEDNRLPTVSMQLTISGAGSLYEPTNLAGLAGITAQMLREGTKARRSRQIAEEIDRLGATLFASSGFGQVTTEFNASGLSDNLDQWVALATDVLLNPSFPAEELNKLKQRTKAELQQQRSSPGFLANERFRRALYGGHPAAVVSATAESIDAMTLEILAKWHKERYAPQNAILGIAGDVRAAEVLPKLRLMLAGWQKTDFKEVLPANAAAVTGKKIYLVNRPDSVQATVMMGNIAIDRRDPDYIPLTVMNRIIGGGPQSRLFINLREEKGYTYGAYSSFNALKYPGPWSASGDVRTEVAEGAMTEFFNEMRRIREERVPETELEDAKRSVVANFALSLENPAQLLGYAITRKLYGFPDDYWDTYPAKVLAVTPDDVQRVARKYVNSDAVQVVAVGDASRIKSVLEKYGPVEVYDAGGNLMGSGAPASKTTPDR